ncbi:MAG: hypothetical protein JW917_07285 [Ignavibacteria bacterium]|nr:hypothetical protein [Ignavibacteria bacterium]
MKKEKIRDKSIKIRCKICGSPAQKGYDVCYFHNPLTLEKRKKDAARGGRKKISTQLPINVSNEQVKSFKKIKLDTIQDIILFMKGIIQFSINGMLDIRQGKYYIRLCESLITAMEKEKKFKFTV